MRRARAALACTLLGVLLAITLTFAGSALGGPRSGEPPRGRPDDPLPLSSEALAQLSPFNRPESYPLAIRPRADVYRPHAPWLGRLVLPRPGEIGPRGEDWVWIVLEQAPAPHADLIGRRLRLRWAGSAELRSLVAAVTTDIRLGETARRAAEAGNVVPARLDGRRGVGPLQSLAGARPVDDVVVALEGVSREDGTLRIARPPLQISGRWQGLVQVLARQGDSDLYRVRHYASREGGFTGPEELIRIPLLPPDRFGRRMFDPRGLARSPLNREGWFISGAPTADGLFTVQAVEPRRLLQIEPHERIRGIGPGMAHIAHGNWNPSRRQRGDLSITALLHGDGDAHWRPGDRALLIHSFGGIGGSDGEPTPGWTVTGHFSFGQARVIRDPFTAEPRFQLRYHQIYANNPNGIVAGTQDASAYSGNLQRGWLGTRPISDALVPLDDDALNRLALHAGLLMARYRTGDGTGVAPVTPATSCVQDSSQALWIAIRTAGDDVGPLGRTLEDLLVPFGMVRSDWRSNAEHTLMAGTGRQRGDDPQQRFVSSQRPLYALLSWRSMMPRRAFDAYTGTFFRAGLPIWLLNTSQIPGSDSRLAPLPPTTLLGRLPVAGTVLRRLGDALFPPVGAPALGRTLLVLGVYTALALPLGLASGLLVRAEGWRPSWAVLRRAAGWLVMPALVEELVFRVLLLPQPSEGASAAATAGWVALSVGLFVLYHPVAGRLWYPPGRQLFDDPRFLLQAALLGLACATVYGLTGSLWSAVLIHWLAVLIWLEPFQGRRRLEPTA